MYKSNIYWNLRVRHINNLVIKHSNLALLGLVIFALYFANSVMALAAVPVVVNILR